MKVRCIYDQDVMYLTKGKIYKVIEVSQANYSITNDNFNDVNYSKGRFEIVKESEMTKSDLVPGKHVVELRDGEKGLILECGVINSNGRGFMHMSKVAEDLTNIIFKNKDIVAVYEVRSECGVVMNLDSYIGSAKEIWRRNDNQEEYDKLMKQIDELKAQAEKLKP